jgi:hypothetical protein
MMSTMRMLAGWAAGVAAAVVWAVSLAIYQPFMEPTGFFTDPNTGQAYQNLGGNNTYWPRDIRQIAILLAFAAAILIAGTARRAIVTAAAGTVVWLGADLVLDRFDVAGGVTAAVLAVAGAAWFTGVALAAGRGRTETPLRYGVATAAGVLGAMVLLLQTPWDEPVTQPDQVRAENALTLFQVGLIAIAFLVAIGLIGPTQQPWRVAALVAAGAAGTTLAAKWPYQGWGMLGLFAVAVAATVMPLAARGTRPARLASLGAAAAAVAFPAVMIMFIPSTLLGSAMTAVAGSPAINSADTDLSTALLGLGAAVLAALLSYLFGRDTALASDRETGLAYN